MITDELQDWIRASYLANRHTPTAVQDMRDATERALDDYERREFGTPPLPPRDSTDAELA